jgi:integrase
VGRVKIPYYVIAKGRGYWRPTKRMKALGFQEVRCGPDGPEAWRIAQMWADRWEAVRTGKMPAPVDSIKLTREQGEAARVYPRGSVGEAWQRYIKTQEWARRPLSTRTKEWWPAWIRIRDMWGDIDPNTITYEMMSDWRNDPQFGLEALHGQSVAHKTLKVWRAFWRIMGAMKYVAGADPSQGIANLAPPPRGQSFREGEVVRRIKAAWRRGYRGLACVMAIAWDTGFSPADVRGLRLRHIAQAGGRIIFDKSVEGRQKTKRAAIGTISARTEALCRAYWSGLGVELTADAFLFRTRSGGPYRDDTLADDFAALRELVAPGDRRQLRDMRRSGAMEAVAGGVSGLALSSKLANSIQSSNLLHRTYAPVDLAAVEAADDARRKGRSRMRQNEIGEKVATLQSGVLQLSDRRRAKPLK